MTSIAAGWSLLTETSAEWIFFVLGRAPDASDPNPSVTERAWEFAAQHGLYRIVFELKPDVVLTSHLVGQLVLLHRRAHHSGGVLRICQFSARNYDVLKLMQLDHRFFNYRSREAAVMGYRDEA